MTNSITDTYEELETKYLAIAKEYLEITEHTMEEALQRHTAIYAFFSAVLAHAKKIHNSAELSYEYAEAEVREDRRQQLVKEGGKTTEGALNTYVKTVPELRELQSKCSQAQHKYNLAKNIVSSLDHQKDMLVQMSANKRAEIKMVSDLG